MIKCETKRLILHECQDKDFEQFFTLNQDPDVMEYFPNIFSYQETIELITKIKNKFKSNGFGFYTCELKENQQFVGSIGLNIPDFNAHFTPCVEIGWRIHKKFWGQGIAVEAAQKCLEIGFTQFNLSEIVSFTAKNNKKSERVMQKLSMSNNQSEEFYHPQLAKDHPLCLHVLYRLTKANWDAQLKNINP